MWVITVAWKGGQQERLTFPTLQQTLDWIHNNSSSIIWAKLEPSEG